MTPEIQAIFNVVIFLVLASLVAYLAHKVSAQVDAKELLKTLMPVLQDVYTKAIEQAETRAKATANPLDDIAVNAVKKATAPYITPQSTGVLYPTPQPPYTVTGGTITAGDRLTSPYVSGTSSTTPSENVTIS